jgi:hypothetical protein
MDGSNIDVGGLEFLTDANFAFGIKGGNRDEIKGVELT